MQLTIESASNPVWGDAAQTIITLDVVFAELGSGPVPFTASAHDVTEHGRDLHERAMAGEFGPVAPYLPPPPPVPAFISDRQFAHELRERGVLTQAEALDFVRSGTIPAALNALIAALPTQAARDDAELLLAGATAFERIHPLTSVIGGAFGWDAAQIDDFFRDAAAR
jgi:hypothetical protein